MRLHAANAAAIAPRGDYVLYWMIVARRTRYSFALDRAIAEAKRLARPLLVFEPLRAGYPWASDRLHAFVAQGMADNAKAFAAAGVTYLSYVEPSPGAGAGLLAALAKRACLVVTDEQPGFFLGRMIAAAAAKLAVRVEVVDGCGLVPLRAGGDFLTAAMFRRHLQKTVHPYLADFPVARPLAKPPAGVAEVAGAILRRWPSEPDLAKLPIDHAVRPVAYRGGEVAGRAIVSEFLADKLPRYADDRNDPDAGGGSGLSPWLHFGHVSTHELVAGLWKLADWDPSRVAGAKATGSREGWWGLPAASEAFLDELITWRELGYTFCHHRADYDRFESLPNWATKTLADHASDPRPIVYSRAQLEAATTHDEIWNAAQRQLVAEGRIHNYLRMLWGKKILEWSPTPRAALATLIELNNKYAVDGRDPNSYSGIFWTLGRFDRAWGPVRPIFGTVRYMSSDNTRKKLDLDDYLRRWAAQPRLL